MEISEIKKVEMSIGFTAGILVGACGAGIAILFFTQLAWYYKLFSAIGEVGIVGNLILALSGLVRQRKALIEVEQEFNMPVTRGKIEEWKKKEVIQNGGHGKEIQGSAEDSERTEGEKPKA